MIDRRQWIIGGIATGLLGRAAAAAARYDAVIAPAARRDVPAGRRFADLGTALAAAPRTGGYRLWLARGDWLGQHVVDVPGVALVGEDRQRTRIAFTAASGMIAPDGKHYGTYRTATLTVTAAGFTARNLTIANDFDGIAEMRKTGARLLSDDPAGPQAVALRLAEGSDAARLDAVDIHSHQDTFFPDAGRVTLNGCLVSGSYDFIFGAGSALFDRCEIRSRLRPDPQQVRGYIAAPSTLRAQPIGLVFDHCRLTRDPGVADGSVFLARPWRPSKKFADGQYGNPDAAGMAAFLDCWLDAHIAPAGWTEMWYTDRSGNPRHMLQPEDARFGEFGSRGPGAHAGRRLPALSAAEAGHIRRLATRSISG
ncbi:pectinesterase family protein [Sphingomonas sp. MA1305]|uniref:pectinesterase family protein n=1 Tax=Sphingomonas sp. MA1305 TaxID=2479204 RepID=UPI0018DF00E5|nr:pectinesterase family protein [Sphingomonas sp. MA1305]